MQLTSFFLSTFVITGVVSTRFNGPHTPAPPREPKAWVARNATLVPTCLVGCEHHLEAAQCGSATRENLKCFCDNKDRFVVDFGQCVMSSKKCTGRDFDVLRTLVMEECGISKGKGWKNEGWN